MRNKRLWMMAAILFGAATLTGCKKDNPNNGKSCED
jgi:hypothetical protein